MSWFTHDLDPLLDQDACDVHDLERQAHVDDGVVVERRSVLWLSAAAVGAMLAGTGSLRAQDPQKGNRRTEGLDYRQFLEQLYPLSRRLVDSKGEDEQAYLMTVAAAMSRLRDPGAPLRKTMQAFRKEHAEDGERFPLHAVSIKLEPGRGFSHHDHLEYNGVIMGIEGEVRIRNYDFVDDVPALDSGETFRIRETRDATILPGRFSTLGCKRENIHDLVAGKRGARVLDVFTFFTKRATSRFLNVEDEPRDPEARIYDAAWKPRRKREQR